MIASPSEIHGFVECFANVVREHGFHAADVGGDAVHSRAHFRVGGDGGAPFRTHGDDRVGCELGDIADGLVVEVYELLGTSLVEAKFSEDGGGTVDDGGIKRSPFRSCEFVFVRGTGGDDGSGSFTGGLRR